MFKKYLVAALVGAVAIGGLAKPARADRHQADVLIQAGHEGRPDCFIESLKLCRNTGAVGEMQRNAVVANEATRVLRAAGLKVLRKPAFLFGKYHVRDAIFIHFDGSETPCSTRASVGYPNVANSAAAAQQWKRLFARQWRWGYQNDNFTDSLRNYYGYKHVVVSDAALVIEGGEITCDGQRMWIQQHLIWEGDAIAYFVSQRLHEGNVPPPP